MDAFLRKQDPYSPYDERRADIESITVEAGERLVLIVEPTADQFGFELRSIQEFFAALHLCDTSRHTEQRHQRFEAIVRLPHWRNVVLFFAGRVGRNFPGEAPNIVEVCRQIDREGPDLYLRRGAFLALGIANDQAFLPNRRMQRSVIEVAMQLLEVRHTPDQTAEIIDALASLPSEDVRDHVIPLLKERAMLLAPERATSVLRCLALFSPGSTEALELLKEVATLPDCRVDCFSAAVQVAEAQTSAINVARELASSMSPAELGLALDSNVQCRPGTVISIIADGAPIEIRSKLIRTVGLNLMRDVPAPIVENAEIWEEYCSTPLATSGSDALREMLRALAVIRKVHQFHDRSSTIETLSKLRAVQSILPEEVIRGDLGDFCSRTLNGVEEALAAPYWILHLLVGEVTEDSLQRFAMFYTRNWDDSFVRSAMSVNLDSTDLLDYVKEKWQSDPDQSQAIVKQVLLEFGGLGGFERWCEVQQKLESIWQLVPGGDRRKYFRSTASMLEFEPMRAALSGLIDRFDGDFLDVLLIGGRFYSRFLRHRSAEPEEQIKSILRSPVITNMKWRQIRQIYSAEGVVTHANAARLQVLNFVMDNCLDSTSKSMILGVLSAAVSTNLISGDELRKRLGGISSVAAESMSRLSVWWPQSTAFYATLVPIVAEDSDTPTRRGAAILLVHSGFARSAVLGHTSTTHRFSGFAALQARLAASEDGLIRAAGTATFFARRATGKSAESSLRKLIRASQSNVEEQLIIALYIFDMQMADRWKFWRNVVEPLLSEKLYGDLNPFLAEQMIGLLANVNQSLQPFEEALDLPLGCSDAV